MEQVRFCTKSVADSYFRNTRTLENGTIKRQRTCSMCGYYWHTIETIYKKHLAVKNN